MSKRLVLLFCALFVFAAVVPAFAAVQNVKVSGDILARYILRNDFDLLKGNGATGEDQINALNTVTRLRVDADLTDNVSTVIRLINERDWTVAGAATTDIDLDLAYVTMKEFLYSPLTLAIGRQELHFGNDMIIGDGVGSPDPDAVSGAVGTNQDTNYTEAAGYTNGVNGDLAYRKAFDAIRATFNYDPLVVDIVYARLQHGTVFGAESNDMINLWGMNAGYKFTDKWNTMAEGYVWSKDNSAIRHVGIDKSDTVTTVGARISTNPTSKVNLQQEMAWQGGKKISPAAAPTVNRERSAWASQSIAMVTPGWKYNPTIGMIYSYFSGDADRNSVGATAGKKYHAWDPMFENQTSGHIINALYSSSNTHNINARLTMSPIEDIVLQYDYVYLLMAKASARTGTADLNDYDGTGNSFKADKKSLGQEFDANMLYNYTEDVQFGLLAGWFWPARTYSKTNGVDQRTTATEMIASCNVKF
ncbi:MAG: hypothetical protein COX96_03190 [Candidatus Omnitrophica bacterium CG_4_10_14_0_2_um_filter_44_9]|nr:MAG: hypothetical protein COX96_03190 [Candidatus Omnitrophica bacterium CG_4_10_14_0_2_um_filter_44_9]